MALFRRKRDPATPPPVEPPADYKARRSAARAERERVKALADAGEVEAAAVAALALLDDVKALNAEDPETRSVGAGNPAHAPALDYYRDAAVLLRKAGRHADEVTLLEDMLADPGITYSHEKWAGDRLPRARTLRDAD